QTLARLSAFCYSSSTIGSKPERCRCNGDRQSDVATIWWERSERGLTRRAMELRPHYREHRVLDALHRAALFCDQRIGWNRIGVALSLTIIAVAAVVLYRILRTMDASEVVEALVTIDLRDVTLAARSEERRVGKECRGRRWHA